MKKNQLWRLALLFVLSFLSSHAHAEYLKATLYMEDGSSKKGWAEEVKTNDSKVNFKTDEKADKEKIQSELIKKIEYTDKNGDVALAERLFIYTPNIFKKGPFSCESKKQWTYVLYNELFKITSEYTGNTTSFYGPKGKHRISTGAHTTYYIGKKNSDRVTYGFVKAEGLAIHTVTGTTMTKMTKEEFSDCPKLIDAVDKENFKAEKALEQFLELYRASKCK
jgi:hypothetical protein